VANGSTATRAMLRSCGPADKSFAQPDHPLRRDFGSIIYNHRLGTHDVTAFGETAMPQVSQPAEEIKIMGDRSPKSNQKKSTQKQSKADSVEQKKKQAVAAKSAAAKNR
jgi:hypothetical protein